MSKTVAQIFATNPTTVVADTDLYYLVQSPYTPGTDAAITGASLKAAFGGGGTINPGLINQLAYYASAGSALSGLATANNGVLITSITGAPSISSTLPNAVQDNITRLGTISSIGSPLGGTYGGTGVNNGASTITIGGSVAFSGAFSFTGTLTNTTSVTFPTSGTLATTSQLPTPAALTKADDTNVTLTLGGTPATALLQATSLTLGWTGQLGLTRGGSNASLTASNGGIVYSTSSALAILSGTATANLPLLSQSSTAPVWGAFALSLGGALTTAGALTTSGAFGATFTFTNTTSVTFPTSGTLATTSQIPAGAALTKTDDTNVTLTLGGSPTTALLNAASLALGWTGTLSVARGGTGLAASDPVVQRVSTQTGTSATGSTTLPSDNTIPQITEGNEYMTLAITPKASGNILKIEVNTFFANSSGATNLVAALFQDSTANALACGYQGSNSANQPINISFIHTMTAGTTSSTTFRVRIGGSAAGTTTFNGQAGSQLYGGVLASSIVITEYAT